MLQIEKNFSIRLYSMSLRSFWAWSEQIWTMLAQSDRFRAWLMPKNYFWDILVKIQWKLKIFFWVFVSHMFTRNSKKIEKKIFNFYYFLILSIFFADFSKKLNFSKNKKSILKFKKSSLLVCSLCHCDHFKPNPNKFGQSWPKE